MGARTVVHVNHMVRADNDNMQMVLCNLERGAVARWKDFGLVTRRLRVQLPPMTLRSSLGQVACQSLPHDASDSFTTKE